ncbi:MAG: hypothetical protein Q7T54_03165 [Candidatus Levybacteria bacterium]|nr:hypothetical protein [Candidatus Levybacteria bacterium]
MHPEGNSGGSRFNKRFSSWLRSGSLRKLNHAGSISSSEQAALPDVNYDSENDDTETPKPHKNRRQTPPFVVLPPNSELLIEYLDGIPAIKIADLSATQQDVIDRLNYQEERISTKPNDQRTPVEKRWIEKRINKI